MSRLQIYIVDSNKEFCISTANWLTALGYRVNTFCESSCFLEWIEKCGVDKPGCLLLEVQRQDLSGFELHNLLKRKDNALPIIYISDDATIALVVEAMKKGAITFLEKPLSGDRLKTALDAVCNNYVENRLISETSSNQVTNNANNDTFGKKFNKLTAREKEVLEGRSNSLKNIGNSCPTQ